jgi:TolB protein
MIREAKVKERFLACGVLLAIVLFLCCSSTAFAQDWVHTGTGLGLEKPRIAVTDFAPRADNTKMHSQLFTQVVRDDLQFSGIVDLVSPSFYPTQVPSVPGELRNADWITPQLNSNLIALGNLTEAASEVVISGWLFDVRSPSTQAVIGKVYRGTPNDAQVRKFAHQFADEIISRLSGGLPGVASTQIAFVSSRTGTKEIWIMDYDGANQRPLTTLHTISLTPRWSPDASRIAFTCFASANGVVSPQICMYSMDAGKTVSFPRFRGSNSAPAWSPDGTQIMFSSSMLGSPELFVVDSNGGRPKRLTFAAGASTSNYDIYLKQAATQNIVDITRDFGRNERPSRAPDGRHIVFESTRNGERQIWSMLADGSQGHQLTMSGHNESPNWSPK